MVWRRSQKIWAISVPCKASMIWCLTFWGSVLRSKLVLIHQTVVSGKTLFLWRGKRVNHKFHTHTYITLFIMFYVSILRLDKGFIGNMVLNPPTQPLGCQWECLKCSVGSLSYRDSNSIRLHCSFECEVSLRHLGDEIKIAQILRWMLVI